MRSSSYLEYGYNKAFKSDSQRLALSLRSSITKRCSHLNAALCAWREVYSAVVSRIQRVGVFKRNVSRKNR
ncbi:hypothetical protein F0254_23575 [Vibrio alginolyticus]|uniref:Uncharacterized protein n=1 Tax=Vibrio alginolyticus TaxID=663 RepID=A0A7Y4F1D2_VIBAL|nr:hypothetical protein [Vibrio alginolyticus]